MWLRRVARSAWNQSWQRVQRATCIACGQGGDGPLCAHCRAFSGVAGQGCRHAMLAGIPLHFAGSYWNRTHLPPAPTPLARSLLRFKHAGDRCGGRGLAALFSHTLAPHAAEFGAVVAVPPAPARAAARGHDPAAWLARSLARRARVPMRSDILVRCGDSIAQRGLGGAARRRNLRGAFTVCAPLDPEYSLLLVDDVCTTGSTLLELAATLARAGVKRIELAVLTCADIDLCRQCPTTIDESGIHATRPRGR